MAEAARKPSITLSEGDAAPEFSMPTANGMTMKLADFKGHENVVLYFYPKDDTPGCTSEAIAFRDLAPEFEAADAVVIGVSKDSIESHCRFRDKYSLSFALASDQHSDVCERYGVWGEKSMYGKKYMGIMRATFLIDKQGKLARIWPKVSVEGHAQEVLDAVKALA